MVWGWHINGRSGLPGQPAARQAKSPFPSSTIAERAGRCGVLYSALPQIMTPPRAQAANRPTWRRPRACYGRCGLDREATDTRRRSRACRSKWRTELSIYATCNMPASTCCRQLRNRGGFFGALRRSCCAAPLPALLQLSPLFRGSRQHHRSCKGECSAGCIRTYIQRGHIRADAFDRSHRARCGRAACCQARTPDARHVTHPRAMGVAEAPHYSARSWPRRARSSRHARLLPTQAHRRRVPAPTETQSVHSNEGNREPSVQGTPQDS